MLIGYDGSRAFIKDRTGTENYSFELLRYLSQIDRKNQYLIYLRPGSNFELEVNKWPKNFQFKILNHKKLWTQIGLSKATFTDSLDVLFVPGHTIPLIRKKELKTVVTVHDLGAEYLPKMHQLRQRLYLSFITRMQLKTATKLIAVSRVTKNDLVEKIGLDPKKIEVIYEGVNLDQFKSIKDDLLNNILSKYNLEKEKYFLFVGTIQPRKNLIRLIKAFAQIPCPYLLVLVGFKGWLSDQIYKLPKKLEIAEKVKFLGFIDNKDLPSLYSGAIALVFPSLFEGFGLPILEAFACECPVLTSNLSSMPEVGGDAPVYVDPYNIDSISQGLTKVMNQESRIKLIKKGKIQVKKFSWRKCARETLGVLEEVCKQ